MLLQEVLKDFYDMILLAICNFKFTDTDKLEKLLFFFFLAVFKPILMLPTISTCIYPRDTDAHQNTVIFI